MGALDDFGKVSAGARGERCGWSMPHQSLSGEPSYALPGPGSLPGVWPEWVQEPAQRVRGAFRGPAAAAAAVGQPGSLTAPLSPLPTDPQRYDVVSTGLGALTVTGYCVYVHGQDPWTALSITFSATVFALVVNEVLLSSSNDTKRL